LLLIYVQLKHPHRFSKIYSSLYVNAQNHCHFVRCNAWWTQAYFAWTIWLFQIVPLRLLHFLSAWQSIYTYNIMRSIFSTMSWHCNEQIFLHHLASLQFSDLIQCESLDPHPLSIPGSWASATVSSHSSSLIITLCRWVSELWSKKRADKMCALYFVYDREMMFRILAWPASLVISSKDIQMQLLFGGPQF
jgi:hypothetical protein